MAFHALSVPHATALAAACRHAADRLRVTASALGARPGTEEEAGRSARAAAWLDEEARSIDRRVSLVAGDPGQTSTLWRTARMSRGEGPGRLAAENATTWRGTPYAWGGSRPGRGLDCSGLVQVAFAGAGVRLPRTSRAQARAGVAVSSLADAKPGDLLCFGRPVHHIAIYVGGGRMVEAPRRGLSVRVVTVRPPSTIRRVL